MFTLGSDAEVLLKDPAGNYRSAIGLIGGSKEAPRKTEHGYVQEDNVLAEFNVNPAKTEKEFVQNTLDILGDLRSLIQPLDLSVDIRASGIFEDSQLDHYLARLAGCDPDYDAWALQENEAPDLEVTGLRSCGGHLHIAFERAKNDVMSRPHLARILDLVAGVPSIIADTDTERRRLYGKAGAHRMKFTQNGDPYDGVEYRTLSNFWLASEGNIAWAYRAVRRSVEQFDELLDKVNSDGQAIVATINRADVSLAKQLVKKYDLEVPDAV